MRGVEPYSIPKPLATLTGHTKPVQAVVFSPDGTQLATGSWDNTARLWDLPRWVSPTPEMICKAVNRDLSKQEWDQYLPGQSYRPTCSSR